jgi:hypothetical protein
MGLLIGDADHLAELQLSQTKHDAALADSSADKFISPFR